MYGSFPRLTFDMDTEVHLVRAQVTCVLSSITSLKWVNGEVVGVTITCCVETIASDWIMTSLPFHRGIVPVNSGT